MSNLLRIIYAMIAHTIILRHRVYGFHSRNHGFLTSRMAVSKTPDTGVTEPGIFSEYHMEVGGIDDFRPAFVHPDLLIHSLTVGAVTVAAGIVVDLGMAAIGTDADTSAQCAGLAPKDGHGGHFVDVGRRINGTVFLPSKLENLLDLTLCHRYLPSYQEDL